MIPNKHRPKTLFPQTLILESPVMDEQTYIRHSPSRRPEPGPFVAGPGNLYFYKSQLMLRSDELGIATLMGFQLWQSLFLFQSEGRCTRENKHQDRKTTSFLPVPSPGGAQGYKAERMAWHGHPSTLAFAAGGTREAHYNCLHCQGSRRRWFFLRSLINRTLNGYDMSFI